MKNNIILISKKVFYKFWNLCSIANDNVLFDSPRMPLILSFNVFCP